MAAAWHRLRLARLTAIAALIALMAAACSSPTAPTSSSSTRPSPGASIDGPQIDQLPTAPDPSGPPGVPGLSMSGVRTATLSQVFTRIQSMWEREFAAAGRTYAPAQLVLFKSQVSTACGIESANTGSFYCAADRTVYVDSQFLSFMQDRFGVSGDFAEDYVVARELGHHIQNLLGIADRVAAAERAEPSQKNPMSVRVELQADCLAGVWAHSAFPRSLPAGNYSLDVLHAGQFVADESLAYTSRSSVSTYSLTHGSSVERQQWFATGYTHGRPGSCDTFASS
jgi:uncharacterized protein